MSAAREWLRRHRASKRIKDAVDAWDEVGGALSSGVNVSSHQWAVFHIDAGAVERVRALRPDVAVFARRISLERLKRIIGNPLAEDDG